MEFMFILIFRLLDLGLTGFLVLGIALLPICYAFNGLEWLLSRIKR